MGSIQVSPVSRFALLLVLSIALMIIDHRSEMLKPVRTVTSILNIPIEALVRLPATISGVLDRYYPDSSLHGELKDLRQKYAALEAKLQRYEALEAENDRLAQLLSASRRSTDEVLLSEIIEFGIEPYAQKIVVNRGVESGVFLGQPAISPEGVLGQVTEVGFRRSVVTLISDSSHGLPVEIQRNGLRSIAHGSGKPGWLRLPYLESQADIRQGDILVTSGLGGRFPVGYKVARITDVVQDANEPFMNVSAETIAKIELIDRKSVV